MPEMDRPEAAPPVDQYVCDCPGFKQLMVERMCVRCLDNYAAGLPHVLSGGALQREMLRVASVLAHHVKQDPSLGRVPVWLG